MIIKDLYAREILDSRGFPTVEVLMTIENGIITKASIPSGASTGRKEALELRDNDESRYNKKGVLKAVDNINTIIKPHLINKSFNQQELDSALIKLDATENKTNLGANAMLAVSIAHLKCLAKYNNKELYEEISKDNVTLPIPMINILNGGEHANNTLSVQEFMIVPVVKSMKERVRAGAEVFHKLGSILNKENYSTSVGDEGGYAPKLKDTYEALDYIIKSITEAGYKPGVDVFIALDIAASEFYNKNDKTYKLDNNILTSNELVKYYIELVNKYPIISIEDPFDEDDFESLAVLTKLIGKKVMLVGDDFFVSNAKYLYEGIKQEAGNAILLKPNQIGTVTEFIKTIDLANKNNYKTVMSHRSGETTDDYLADFAVGFKSNFIKTGSMSRGERIVKYNRLMEIEERLKK